jgi:hypothetical protein
MLKPYNKKLSGGYFWNLFTRKKREQPTEIELAKRAAVKPGENGRSFWNYFTRRNKANREEPSSRVASREEPSSRAVSRDASSVASRAASREAPSVEEDFGVKGFEEQMDPRKQYILGKLKNIVSKSSYNLYNLNWKGCDYFCMIKKINDLFFENYDVKTELVLLTILGKKLNERSKEDMELYFHFMPIANFGYDYIELEKLQLYGTAYKKNITERNILKNVKTIDWKLLNDKYIEEFDIIAKSGFSPASLKIKPAYYGGFRGFRRKHKTSKKKMYKKMYNNRKK